MCRRIVYWTFIISFVLVFHYKVWAQGPGVSYYYNRATELSWAECHLYQQGGSRQKIPFLPVTNYVFRSPSGTQKYSNDIDVNAPIVFVGNGIVKENEWNSYVGRRLDYTSGDINVTGKIVMFCYDFPDSIELELKEDMPLELRIVEASSRNASGVILFSNKQAFPFLYLRYKTESDIPHIPVISITKNSAMTILSSAGFDSDLFFKQWEESGKPKSAELISNVRLTIKGNFDNVETEKFSFHFRRELISKEAMEELSQVNEKSLQFLFDCFEEIGPLRWEKLFSVYFRDYDSKVFYTHHWGKGMAGDAGVFMVYEGKVPDFGLAVHENGHKLTMLNWGGSSSFMSEGVAKYVEALAIDKNENHFRTVQFLKEDNLFPLEEMVEFNIGMPGLKTTVGYPAAGSFIGFLVDAYSMKSVKEAYILEGRSDKERKMNNSWEKVFKK